MTALERNVQQTTFRLKVNDWFGLLGWSLLSAAAGWIVLILIIKLFGLSWPLYYILGGMAGFSLVIPAIMAQIRQCDRITSAAELDRAAGLKERSSSGLYCLNQTDPFSQAVVQDAEDINRRISVRSFIRYQWPSSLSFAAVAVVLALIVTLIPISPLQANQKLADRRNPTEEAKRTEVKRVKRQLDSLRESVEKNSGLKDLQEELKKIDNLPIEKLEAASVRREAIKKIDQYSDAIKDQQQNPDQRKMEELKKMFRSLKTGQQPTDPMDKLSQALAKSDFKSAQDALKEMKEQLAKLSQESDQQKQQEMQKKVDELAKKLDQAAQQQQAKEQLQKEMEQAGVDKETAKKLLENLTKQDIQKAAEEMKKKGASEQQVKEMQKKCEACNSAGQQGKQMAEAMQKAAQAMQQQSGLDQASQQLDQAGEQISKMEQMEQQVNEMESTLADLQQMKNDLSNDGKGSKGESEGDGEGEGKGQDHDPDGKSAKGKGGMGNLGKGRGGRGDEEVTAVKFKKERSPVITGKGSIISKMFVNGEQIKGDVSSEAVELITAADRDATDAINKNDVPNQYRNAVKTYFSNTMKELKGQPPVTKEEETSNEDKPESEPRP